MRLLNIIVQLYRSTLKHVRPVHLTIHWGVTRAIFPVMERLSGFRTMPDDPMWFRFELLTSRHEPDTLRIIRQRAKQGMVVLDIGAHVGYYSRHFSHLIGHTGKCFAFEPHPRTFSLLSRNMQHFENIEPVQAAVADTAGTAELYDYLVMSASGSLNFDENLRNLQKSQLTQTDVAPRVASDFPLEKYAVNTLVIDDFLVEKGIEVVDLIKMDIEGAEIGALRGLRATIERSPDLMLVMEYNPRALEAFGHDPASALQEVAKLGFTRMQIIEREDYSQDIETGLQTLAAMTPQMKEHMDVVNLLLTRA